MTTTRHIYAKCPKCGKIIFTEEVMSTNVMGHGLNYEPHTGGTDPKRLAVLACPKCEYTDYQSQFKEIKREERGEKVGFDTTPTNIKYFRIGEKLKKKKEYKNALWAFLTSSWYSSAEFKKKCLLNVLDLIIKSFESEKLRKEEKIDLLNLGL
ncbi:MAG: DUF2225 domain-containing protein, partial [Candidatus Woesearchaeota archaeon]|nr:DUF2225 domain-containing protein [Candidatus Woesearchaeota archaeon]